MTDEPKDQKPKPDDVLAEGRDDTAQEAPPRPREVRLISTLAASRRKRRGV